MIPPTSTSTPHRPHLFGPSLTLFVGAMAAGLGGGLWTTDRTTSLVGLATGWILLFNGLWAIARQTGMGTPKRIVILAVTLALVLIMLVATWQGEHP